MSSLLHRISRQLQTKAAGSGGRVEPLTERVQQSVAPVISNKVFSEILDAQDRTSQVSRQGKPGHIHVSSLIGFCERRQVLLHSHTDLQSQLSSVSGSMQVLWALGRAAETHVRGQLIAARRSDIYGIWRCKCEFSSHVGFYASRSCDRCKTSVNVYHEHPLTDDEAGVVGNPDLLIRMGQSLMVIEIKSMNKKEWDGLLAPKGDHIFQAGWYVNMLRRKGFSVHDNAHVIYVAKDYLFGSPYKEHVFNACTPARITMIETSRQAAIVAHNCIKNNTIPPRLMCESHNSTLAKQCPVVAGCFNRN